METIIGQPATQRFTANAIRTMQEAIGEAGGNEVFFAGALSEEGIVETAVVCARGHQGAVPAVFERLSRRDVVIHNHPSGNLTPSEADLELAAMYSHNGHGVYIIDNTVESVYAVIEPYLDENKTRLNPDELSNLLSPGSRLSKAIPDFEIRPQQQTMMEVISEAFNRNSIAVVEAPTGVGKTMAYLLPAIKWAVENRERIVISTRTINLQEQIMHKDIPLLQNVLGSTFSAVLVKGRANYLCKKRLDRALSEATLFDDEEDQEMLKSIAAWAETTNDGSKSDLSFVPPYHLWERVCSESDTCTASQCMAAKNCFVSKARREIAKADLLIVNHHMLFSDLAIKKETGQFSSLAVLPAYERLIIDEGHHIEDSATEYFGIEATQNGAMSLLGRFVSKERGQERGLIPFIKRKVIHDCKNMDTKTQDQLLDMIDNTLLPGIAASREALVVAFQSMRSYTADTCKQIGRDIKWRLTPAILQEPGIRDIHKVYFIPASEELHILARLCTQLLSKMASVPNPVEDEEHPLSTEIAQLQGYRDRLQRLANALAECLSESLLENTVRWVEIDADRTHIVRIVQCPLDIGEQLAKWAYPNFKSMAITSATLSVGKSFDFFLKRTGLSRIQDRPVETCLLDSPFDFQAQAILGIPDDIATPESRTFIDECTEAIRQILKATHGRAFILFTSFYALNISYKKLESELREAGITPLKQGSQNRTQLLDRFKSDTHSVLFGTDSFWEGVDVAGEALQCVILPKLPFRVPTEPIIQARAEQIEQSGGNAFMEYTIPLAVIKFRQGFGRLIRRKSDRGVVIVLDTRILTKHYGKIFLKSLPALKTVKGPLKEVHLAVNKFFESNSSSTKESTPNE